MEPKVEHFYDNMEWEVGSGRVYKDAWGLRKLYSYALRREADCWKREQTPNDLDQDNTLEFVFFLSLT